MSLPALQDDWIKLNTDLENCQDPFLPLLALGSLHAETLFSPAGFFYGLRLRTPKSLLILLIIISGKIIPIGFLLGVNSKNAQELLLLAQIE